MLMAYFLIHSYGMVQKTVASFGIEQHMNGNVTIYIND